MKQNIESLRTAVKNVLSGKVEIFKPKFDLENFKDKKAEYLKSTIEQSIRNLKAVNLCNEPNSAKIVSLVNEIDSLYKEKKLDKIIDVAEALSKIPFAQKSVSGLKLAVPRVPFVIQAEVSADIKELEKCFNADCYRSAIILCGRVLETALHRKYYDLTNNDILETSPSIGLGNMIAKLREKGFEFDPGVSEQIHLINQVRIYSVHKKQSTFQPTKEQSQAIILYTIDIVKKIF